MRNSDAIIKFSTEVYKALGKSYDQAGSVLPEIATDLEKIKRKYLDRASAKAWDYNNDNAKEIDKNSGGFGIDYVSVMKGDMKNLIREANLELKSKVKEHLKSKDIEVTDLELEHDLDLFDPDKDKFYDEEQVLETTFMNDGRSLKEVYAEERKQAKEERAIVVMQTRLDRKQAKKERELIEAENEKREKSITDSNEITKDEKVKVSDERKKAIDEKLNFLLKGFSQDKSMIIQKDQSKDHTKDL